MREFSLGTILTMTTGRFLTTFDELYDLASYMSGEEVWTHQLPRVKGEAGPVILKRYPQLAEIEVPTYDESTDKESFYGDWLATQEERYGKMFALEPLSAEEHASIDPLTEFEAMGIPAEKIIPVRVSEWDGNP